MQEGVLTSYPPTPEDIITVSKILVEAQETHKNAKLAFIKARNNWDDAFARLVYNGEIEGRNEAQRHGAAIEMMPDLWREFVELSEKATEAEFNVNIAKILAKTLDRMLLMSDINSRSLE